MMVHLRIFSTREARQKKSTSRFPRKTLLVSVTAAMIPAGGIATSALIKTRETVLEVALLTLRRAPLD